MKIHLKCFAGLPEKYDCDYTGSSEHNLLSGETIEQFASRMNISEDDMKLMFINGKKVDKATILKNGDRLAFAPATGGM